jgi:hypothetical protein
MSGNKSKEYTYPLEKSDHPEIAISEELHYAGIKLY